MSVCCWSHWRVITTHLHCSTYVHVVSCDMLWSPLHGAFSCGTLGHACANLKAPLPSACFFLWSHILPHLPYSPPHSPFVSTSQASRSLTLYFFGILFSHPLKNNHHNDHFLTWLKQQNNLREKGGKEAADPHPALGRRRTPICSPHSPNSTNPIQWVNTGSAASFLASGNGNFLSAPSWQNAELPVKASVSSKAKVSFQQPNSTQTPPLIQPCQWSVHCNHGREDDWKDLLRVMFAHHSHGTPQILACKYI